MKWRDRGSHLRLLSVLNLSTASHSGKARGKGVAAFVVRRDSDGVGDEWCEAGHTSIEARLALLQGYETHASSSAAARVASRRRRRSPSLTLTLKRRGLLWC